MKTTAYLERRRPNGLPHAVAARSSPWGEEGVCLPSYPLPTVPAEQRHAIFRLRCKYSLQVWKAPTTQYKGGVGWHRYVTTQAGKSWKFTNGTRVRAVRKRFLYLNSIANLLAIVAFAEFAMSTLIFQCSLTMFFCCCRNLYNYSVKFNLELRLWNFFSVLRYCYSVVTFQVFLISS